MALAKISTSRKELIALLDVLAQNVMIKLDADITAIDQAAFDVTNRTPAFQDSEELDRSQEVLKATWLIVEELRAIKKDFAKLHEEHVTALRKRLPSKSHCRSSDSSCVS